MCVSVYLFTLNLSAFILVVCSLFFAIFCHIFDPHVCSAWNSFFFHTLNLTFSRWCLFPFFSILFFRFTQRLSKWYSFYLSVCQFNVVYLYLFCLTFCWLSGIDAKLWYKQTGTYAHRRTVWGMVWCLSLHKLKQYQKRA